MLGTRCGLSEAVRRRASLSGHIVRATPGTDDLKRCTTWCKACVRRSQQDNAEHMADYHRRRQQANLDKRREHSRRYLEDKCDDPERREQRRANDRRRAREWRAEDPDYRERRRENNRRYRERKRARLADPPPEAADSGSGA
jgi:hypothetical protein